MRSPTCCSAPTARQAACPQASRGARARSPIITRTSRPAGRTRRADLQPYKAHFRGIPNSALYPFGHGLTYGKIEYCGARAQRADHADERRDRGRATITNRGTRAAEEVVQLYIHDRAASVTRPVRELKAFRKIALAPGQSEVVRFTLRAGDLAFYGRDASRRSNRAPSTSGSRRQPRATASTAPSS